MKKILCAAFVLLLLSPSLMAEQILLDRLIVEINGKAYSQKQMEIYELLRTIAMGEAAANGLPAANRWNAQLESFKNDMVVYTLLENDQQKLESYAPDPKRVLEAEHVLVTKQASDKELDQFIRQRQLSEADISRILTQIYRIEGFVKSRAQLSASKTTDEAAFAQLDPNADWFLALARTTAYRYYNKAKEYRPLVPFKNN